MLHQTFAPRDLLIVGLLTVLEGLLSIDNALVLGLLARRLPESQRSRALSYGLIGSFIFRLVAITVAAWLLKWRFIKLIGGGYLVYISVKHFFDHRKHHRRRGAAPADAGLSAAPPAGFWSTVSMIELTDIAFAADSILAAIALVGPAPAEAPIHPKFWVILLGGMLGVIVMRFAAFAFIKLLEKFPRFEISAYLLVLIVGLKLICDYLFNTAVHRLDFESARSPVFWLFWGLMAVSFAVGFLPRQAKRYDAGHVA